MLPGHRYPGAVPAIACGQAHPVAAAAGPAGRDILALIMTRRPCSRVNCDIDAVATLTYVYADSMAVLGPLSDSAEPHSYDLCAVHAERLSPPQGWTILRHASFDTAP